MVDDPEGSAPTTLGRRGRPAMRPWRAPRHRLGIGVLKGVDALRTLDASADAILGMDDNGVCLFLNTAAERLFCYPGDELVGSGVHLLVPRLARAVRALIVQRTRPERPRTAGPAGDGVELVGMRRGGSTFPAMVWLTPVCSARRLVVLATVRDLSPERSSAAATQALLDDVHELRAVVSAVTAAIAERAIILVDAHGYITAFNPAAQILLGYREQDIVGRPTLHLSDPADVAALRAELRSPPGVDPLLEITRSGVRNQQPWTFLTRDGGRRPVELSITAIGPPSDPVGFVCAVQPLGTSRALDPLDASAGRLLLDLADVESRAPRR